MGSTCSICRDRAKRDLVDAALIRGEKPSEIFVRYPDVASRSALYRHCRSHAPRSSLTPQWVSGESTSGDVLADLDSVRIALVGAFRDAVERGADAVAQRAAREISTASTALVKVGLENDDDVSSVVGLEQLIRTIQRAATDRPGFALELAEAARARGNEALAADADALAQAAIARQPKIEN